MKRDAFFDNARLLLIFFVVFGHLIQPYQGDVAILDILYTWIYTFHMPAFILLAGFFAKGSGNPGYIMKLIKKLLVPYLIFQGLYTAFYYAIGRSNWLETPILPHWALWFLMSLFSWHMLLVVFKRMKPWFGISLAVIIGILVGYIDSIGTMLSLSRTFVFFPFFLAGYWLTKEQMLTLRGRFFRIAGAGILIAAGIIVYLAPELSSGWLLASKSFSELGVAQAGGVIRAFVYITAALMTFSILAWIPNKQLPITELGQRTIYVYLLHGFFIQFFRETDLLMISNAFDVLGLVVMAALIVLILSNQWMLSIWQPFIEGKTSRIRKLVKSTGH